VKILLAHADEERRIYYADEVLARLRGLGDVRLNTSGQPLKGRAFVEAAQGCQIIVGDIKSVADAEVFGGLNDLIAYVYGHVDHRRIDVAAASANGILVTHAEGHFAAGVAELVIGFMIDLSRGITRSTLRWRSGDPPVTPLSSQLAGHVLGIIGYGRIGRHLAKLGYAIGMRVLVSDPGLASAPEPWIELVTLDALLAASDFVVPMAPALPTTANLIDAAALARMKRSAYLINASRGELIDEAALEDALDRGIIAGAAMDVGRAPYEFPSPRFAKREDVLVTPHIGGVTPEALRAQATDTVAQVTSILRGEVPAGPLNLDRATRFAQFAASVAR
jgi:D-3-phosphoglycerate dehydrogenase